MTMVPPETLFFTGYDHSYSCLPGGCGGGGGAYLKMNDHDRVKFSSGDACSVSDRTVKTNGTNNNDNNGCSNNNNISMAADIHHQDDSRTNSTKEDTGGSASKDVTELSPNAADNNTVTTDFDQTNMKDDEGWLRLGIGGREIENPPETAKYEGSCVNVNNRQGDDPVAPHQTTSGRKGLLELNLFSGDGGYTSASAAASVYHSPAQPQHHHHHHHHHQSMTMNSPFDASLYYQHLFRPQLLHQSPSFLSSSSCSPASPFPPSTPNNWMPPMSPYSFAVRPFQPSLGGLSNNNLCVNNVGTTTAGPSSDFIVVNPPRRPHSGLWFILQASENQAKEPFLPQVNKSYLRIKDGRMTVRLLMKYLMKKLQLDSESEIEIKCKGQKLSPLLTMEHVRDRIWSSAKDSSSSSSSSSFTLLPDSSTDHVMILHYGRSPSS